MALYVDNVRDHEFAVHKLKVFYGPDENFVRYLFDAFLAKVLLARSLYSSPFLPIDECMVASGS